MMKRLCLAIPVFCLATIGCQPKPAEWNLIPVEGKVTVRGTPLAKGAIQFVPDKTRGNNSLVTSAGTIKDGIFRLETVDRSDAPGRPGAPPGSYSVIITSLEIGDSATPPRSLVNTKYNTINGGLRAEITAEGKNSFQFDLDP